MTKPSTGELLLQRGAVTPEVLQKAQRAAAAGGGRVCSQLLAMGACDEGVLAAVLAEKHGVPGVDLSRTVVPTEVLDKVPRAVAEGDHILPLSLDGGRLHLAMASPREGDRVVDEVRFVTGLEVSSYIAVVASLKRAIAGAYAARDGGEALWRGAAAAGAARSFLAHVMPAAAPEEEEEDVLEVRDEDVVPVAEREAGEEPALEEVEISVGGDDAEADAGEEVVSAGAGTSPRAAPGPRRVLVVDDEPEIRLLVQRTLEARGFQTSSAADGEEALARIGAELPDLVLLDAMLPRLHGFEVARRVRSEERTRSVPIIIMTAIYRGWRFAQDARENYGAEDYVEKPFHIDDLLRRIDAVLESTASRRPLPSADPQFQRGKELLLAGQLDAAVAAFEEALRVEPFSADAHYHLAKALRAKGDHYRAMTAFERAAELRPAFFPALRSLAALYTEKGFRRKATETLERALAAAPDGATRQTLRTDLLKLL